MLYVFYSDGKRHHYSPGHATKIDCTTVAKPEAARNTVRRSATLTNPTPKRRIWLRIDASPPAPSRTIANPDLLLSVAPRLAARRGSALALGGRSHRASDTGPGSPHTVHTWDLGCEPDTPACLLQAPQRSRNSFVPPSRLQASPRSP